MQDIQTPEELDAERRAMHILDLHNKGELSTRVYNSLARWFYATGRKFNEHTLGAALTLDKNGWEEFNVEIPHQRAHVLTELRALFDGAYEGILPEVELED